MLIRSNPETSVGILVPGYGFTGGVLSRDASARS